MIRTSSPWCIPGLFFFFFSHHYFASAGRKQLSEAFGEQYISCRLIQNTFAASHKIHLLNHTKYIWCITQNTLAQSHKIHLLNHTTYICSITQNTFAQSHKIQLLQHTKYIQGTICQLPVNTQYICCILYHRHH